jgi:hypothetical protein
MASKHELTIIAQFELAKGVSKKVKGMEGFADYFIRQLPVKDVRLIHRYLTERDAQIDTFLKQAEADGWNTKQ